MRRSGAVLLALAVTMAAGTGVARASFYGKHYGPLPPISNAGAQGPVGPADINIIENLGQKVPRGLVFTEGHGGAVSLDELLGRGKPVLVTLGYYHCPMLCNLVHEGLAKAVKGAKLEAGRDFVGLAVSVDPDEDPKSANTNQGRLLRFLGHNERNDWPFTYGASKGHENPAGMEAVTALAESVGFKYKYDPQSKQFAHTAVAFVLAPDGKISRYLYGVDFPPRDLRFALVEASGGRVGTSLDRVLLSCFRYDPMTQRYTPYAAAFVRIGAALSFFALAGLLAVLWRREIVMRRRRLA
jgi:protein SCO1